VEYLVDGQRASLTDRIPYTCTIPASMLGAGSHSLKVITRAGESEYTKSFTLHVQSDGTVSAEAILHEGGRATCSAKAVCTVCGQPYGEIDPNAHAVSSVWSFSDGRHYHICENGCGTLFDAVACSGGAADCVNKAVCAVCGHPYGSLSEHQPQNRFTTLDGRHARRCQTAGCTAVFDEGACADSDSDRICDICFGAMPIKARETTAVSETAATAESTTASTEATASPESNASSSQAEASVSLPSPDSSDSPQATAAPAEPKSTSPAFESEPESEEELTDSSPSNGTLLPLVGLAALSLIVVAVVLWRLVRKW